MGGSIDEVAFGIEMIVDVGVDGSELLQRLHSSKSEHRSFSSSEGEVAVFGPVVGVPTNLMLVRIAKTTSPQQAMDPIKRSML